MPKRRPYSSIRTVILVAILLGARGLTAQTNPAGALPPLPHWSSASSQGTESIPQITVLPAMLSTTVAGPGSTFNITASFLVASHVPTDLTLDLFLLNAQGMVFAEKHDDLNNNLLILPTSHWSGPIAITQAIAIPPAARGMAYVMLSLSSPHGPVALTAAPGIEQDRQHRFYIGALMLQPSAQEPRLTPPPTLDLSRYTLTFSDEFNAASISDAPFQDHSRWYAQNEQCCMAASDGAQTAMAPRAGPNNPFLLTPPNGLTIRLQRTADRWTSGVLTSVDSKGHGFSQMYGYFEMRAHFPEGLNTWPAFWLLNTASKSTGAPAGEIDIVEYIANPAFSHYIATTLHDWSDRSTPAMSHHMVDLPTRGFHTYGMLWTATTMTFFFDGGVTFQCPTPAIMHQPYYLLFDLGLGSGWPTRDTPHRNDMQIQYIRAYKAR